MKYEITSASDWQNLVADGLTTVVDPMIYRCGEIFLAGAKSASNPEDAWSLLDKNIHSVGMFFDRLILDTKLPVFNYADTFDSTLNFDNRVLTRINDKEEILFDVDVSYDAYWQVKKAALNEIQELYQGERKIEARLANDILSELSKAEYVWSPDLGDLDQQLDSEQERNLARFFVGGLIFGGYAQQLESEHVLQPKRSRLFLAAALRAKSTDYKLEKKLFGELKAKANTRCGDLPWFPTFFPYLLSKAKTPNDLLREAVALRHTSGVAEYRSWLKEVIDDWTLYGKINDAKVKDVHAIAQDIDRRIGAVSWAPKIDLKVTMANVVAMKLPGSIDFTPTAKALWGWFLPSLPGKRYRKLLSRAIVEDQRYDDLVRCVKTVWRAG